LTQIIAIKNMNKRNEHDKKTMRLNLLKMSPLEFVKIILS